MSEKKYMEITKQEYDEELKHITDTFLNLYKESFYDAYLCVEEYKQKFKLAEKYIQSLEGEINRVGGFLAVHNFPGYSWK